LVGAVSALRSLAEDPARREHLGDQARRDARDRTYARRMEKIRGFVIQRLNALRQVG